MRFDCATQTMGALREAAYRLIPIASCLIEAEPGGYLCRLQAKDTAERSDGRTLRQHFIDLVTDENLREKVSTETSGVRDVILALAFGALASSTSPP